MNEMTSQMQEWSGDFGKEYTDRNPLTSEEAERLYLDNYGIRRSDMNAEFLRPLDREIKILEVGSNVGIQLQLLQEDGFRNLYGLELQAHAVELSKNCTKGINIIQGSAFDIPFKDDFFDLVFTSGVLIHIAPEDVHLVMDGMYRCSSRFIWGFEYYADTYTPLEYRGRKGLLWKTDFARLFLARFPDLELVKERRFKYLDSDNLDTMFLLQKR